MERGGVACSPCVKVGDYVCCGQVIGTPESALACPVHASVSGNVTAIESRAERVFVVIENDGSMALDPTLTPYDKRLSEATAEEIIDIVRRAGITDMGGDGLPCHEKIRSAIGRAGRLIINGAESEPYVTATHRLLLESPEQVIHGAKILLRALGLRRAEIAVEDNKLDAINLLESMTAGSDLIKIRVLLETTPISPKDAAAELAAHTGAEVIGVVGGVIILYRYSQEKHDKEKQKEQNIKRAAAAKKRKVVQERKGTHKLRNKR